MIQKITLLLVVTLLQQTITAQTDIKKGIVYYAQIESAYMGHKNGKERLATLVFNKKESIYVSQKDSLDLLMNTSPTLNDSRIMYTGGLPATAAGSQVYTNTIKDSVWSSFLRDGLQYVAEKKHQFKWNLSNETKKIGSFLCYKATTTFRGRHYIAWYSPDIPLSFGPWKLQGLPGLILEAYDEGQDINYFFKSIEYPTTNPTPIKFTKPNNGSPIKWYSMKEYIAFCEAHLQKMYERMLMVDKKFPSASPSVKETIEQTFKEITE